MAEEVTLSNSPKLSLHLRRAGFDVNHFIDTMREFGDVKSLIKFTESDGRHNDIALLFNHVYAFIKQLVIAQHQSVLSSIFETSWVDKEPSIATALAKPNYLCTLLPQWLIAASHSLHVDLLAILDVARHDYPELVLSLNRGSAPIALITVHHYESIAPYMGLTAACWVTVTEQNDHGVQKETCMVLTAGCHVWNDLNVNTKLISFKVRIKSGSYIPCTLRPDLSTPEFALFETDLVPGSQENILPLSISSRLGWSSFNLLFDTSTKLYKKPSTVWKCGYETGITSGIVQYEDPLLLIKVFPTTLFESDCFNSDYFGYYADSGALIWGQVGALLIPVGLYVASDTTTTYGISLESIRKQLRGKCQGATVTFPPCHSQVQDYVRGLESEIYRNQVDQFLDEIHVSYVGLTFTTPHTLDDQPSCLLTSLAPDSIDACTKEKLASYRISVNPQVGTHMTFA